MDWDSERGEALLRKAADSGNVYAAYTQGKALLDGDVLLQDIPEALRLITEAADGGFSSAQYLLGKILYRGEVTGQDIPKALSYLENASVQDHPYAAYLAGKILLTEESVKDVQKAIRYFEIASDAGNDFAEYQLGKLYLYSKEVPQDYEKAMEYLFLFEAPIDMLSYITMAKDSWQHHSYAAACSVCDKVMFQMLKDNPNIKYVFICFDNDEAGQSAARKLTDKLSAMGIPSSILVPTAKDWNEDLGDYYQYLWSMLPSLVC